MISETRQRVNIFHRAYNHNPHVISRLAGFTKNYELKHWSNHGKIY